MINASIQIWHWKVKRIETHPKFQKVKEPAKKDKINHWW